MSPPHVMTLRPGAVDQGVFSTDHDSAGPYIMWPGTPYDHYMMPVADGEHPMENGFHPFPITPFPDTVTLGYHGNLTCRRCGTLAPHWSHLREAIHRRLASRHPVRLQS